jgi:hypothetical protein
MNFHKKGKFLKNLVILKPQWLSDVATKIITVKKHDYISNGIIESKKLHELWKEMCPEESDRKGLINLMQDCEFLYQIGIRNYLIPSMINASPPKDLDIEKEITEKNSTLKQSYVFEFLPMDFFTRFLVRFNKFTESISVWKSGALTKTGEEKSLILVKNENIFSIEVNGDYPPNLLSIATNVVDTLLKEYSGIQYSIEISCPNCLIIHHESQGGVFKLSEIKKAIFQHKNKIECSICKQSSKIDEMYDYHPRNEIILRILNSAAKEEISPNKREFIHRQYLTKIQKQNNKETPLLFPYLTEGKIVVYNICQHAGYWHFVPNVKYILNEDKKNELFFKDEFTTFQKYLSMLNQILEKIPPLKIPDHLIWKEMLENSKKIESYIPDDIKFRNETKKRRDLSFFDIIMESNQNVQQLHLVKIPTLGNFIFSFKWFNSVSCISL